MLHARFPKCAVTWSLVATLTMSPMLAHAQGASNEAASQALFDEARKLMQEGKYDEACPKFADSNRLSPGAGTLLNLGACYEKSGQTASAWATYADAASQADHAGRKDWATRAKAKMDALAPTLSKLSIVVPNAAQTSGFVVKRDGVAVGMSEYGVAIPVDPGKHTIEASADGKKSWSTIVAVDAKHASTSVTVPALDDATDVGKPIASLPVEERPANATEAKPEPKKNDSKRGDTQRYLGLGLAGVGVVGLGVGIVLGLVATSDKGTAEDNCNNDLSLCNRQGVDAMSSARGAATVSTIGFVAGGALLVGGAALFFTAPKGSPVATVGLRVTPSAGGGHLSLGGTW